MSSQQSSICFSAPTVRPYPGEPSRHRGRHCAVVPSRKAGFTDVRAEVSTSLTTVTPGFSFHSTGISGRAASSSSSSSSSSSTYSSSLVLHDTYTATTASLTINQPSTVRSPYSAVWTNAFSYLLTTGSPPRKLHTSAPCCRPHGKSFSQSFCQAWTARKYACLRSRTAPWSGRSCPSCAWRVR
jgi:hypothetical protein